MDMSYLASYALAVIGIAAGCYLLTHWIFRRSIVSLSDPLVYTGLIVCCYIAGALVFPSVHSVNKSYVDVLILIAIYFASAAVASRPPRPSDIPQLATPRHSQVLFAVTLTGLLGFNLVVNQLFGTIPLISGTQDRAAPVASAVVNALSPFAGTTVLLLYLFSCYRRVRQICMLGIATSILSIILGGSKSALFAFLIMLLAVDFVRHIQLLGAHTQRDIFRLKRSISSVRRSLIYCLGITVAALPLYLNFIMNGSGGGSMMFATRLFGGFDGLVIVGASDVDLFSAHGLSIWDFYLYPILKKLGHAPDFQSAGSYLIYRMSGDYNFATSGLNPNSSMPIELLLTNHSLIISSTVTAVAAIAVFRLRSFLMSRHRLRVFDLILWTMVVFGPFSILIDGSYFVTTTYIFLGLYLVINIAINVLIWVSPKRKMQFHMF